MNPRVRKAALAAAFLGTLGLVIAEYRSDSSPPKGGKQPARVAGGPEAKPGEVSKLAAGGLMQPLNLPERPELGEARGDLFSSQTFQPPPPKVAPGPPPAPVAPPLPYRFAGKIVQGDEYSIILSKGDLVFPIKEGETIDGAYKVESVANDKVTFLYLPLRQKMTLSVASELPVRARTVEAPQPRPSPPQAVAPVPTAPAGPVSGPGMGDAAPARLHWEGPQKVRLGTRFDVLLKVTSGQPLRASPMQLRFDPAYLELVEMKPGKYFGNGERNFTYRASPDGSIFVGASSQNPAPATDAELLVLTFKPVKAGPAAELTMASLNLHGPAGLPIAFSQPEAFKTAIAP